MKLSHSLHRGIMETAVGAIFNKFMQASVKRRRNTLFFEDIVAEYIKLCEEKGYGKETFEMGYEWFSIIFPRLFSKSVLSLPKDFVLNTFLCNLWKILGVVDDMHIKINGNKIIAVTYGDSIIRLIGRNQFYVGLISGMYSVLFNKANKCLQVKQTKKESRYVFELLKKPPKRFPSKTRQQYLTANKFTQEQGFDLKTALKKGIFTLTDQKLFFRRKHIWYVENTIFHIFGNHALLFDHISRISYNYFKSIVMKTTTPEEKIRLLKTLLQVMGWGKFTFTLSQKSIRVYATNLPVGFQKEKENMDFLFLVMEGYLRTINKKYRLSSKKQTGTVAKLEFKLS